MDKIEKIRQEIERRLKYTHDWLQGDEKRHPNQTFISKNYYKMKGDERTLDTLLNFLDTLSEEPDKSLDEEMDRFFEEMSIQEHENIFEDTYQMIARHFYELGKNSK